VSKARRVRDSQVAAVTRANSERLRLLRGQLVLMFNCVALFSFIATVAATAFGVGAFPVVV
jgi:hypothetical protein